MTERLSYQQRVAGLRWMARDGVDILVVGGGITGAGVALDAAARGYRVGLVEKADFAGGTSSKSTKLIHGGIRYLPQFDFGLVHEALVERGLLTRNAPFLVRPIGFVLPLYAGAKRPLGTPIVPPSGIGMRYLLRAGLMLYDLLAGHRGISHHRRLGARRAVELIPDLKAEGLVDAFLYFDAQTDDTRLTTTVIRSAALHGALVANYAEVVGFDQAENRITAARVRDHRGEETLTIPVGAVVNAGGVFAGRIEALTGGESHIRIEPAKGVHLTVSRSALKMDQEALVLPETDDGRILFIVPWGSRLIIGTTDTEGGDLDQPVASPEDISYLLRHANRYTHAQLTEADVISAWAGFRPLLSSRRGGLPSSKLSRTHAVIDSPAGMVTIVGGKLTTYRRMAQDVMDHVAHQRGDRVDHVTAHLPLDGTIGWRQANAAVETAAPRFGLQADTVRFLAEYGANAQVIIDLLEEDATLSTRIVPDLPRIMAEVVYACRYEMAINLDDVLDRRLHITNEDWDHGVGAARAVAIRMAQELGWEPAETDQQIARYKQLAGPVFSSLHGGVSR